MQSDVLKFVEAWGTEATQKQGLVPQSAGKECSWCDARDSRHVVVCPVARALGRTRAPDSAREPDEMSHMSVRQQSKVLNENGARSETGQQPGSEAVSWTEENTWAGRGLHVGRFS